MSLFTVADVIGKVANAVGLVPNRSGRTCELVTFRILRLVIPDVTLDILLAVIVWKVVAVRLNEFLRARVVELAAKLADCSINTDTNDVSPHICQQRVIRLLLF